VHLSKNGVPKEPHNSFKIAVKIDFLLNILDTDANKVA